MNCVRLLSVGAVCAGAMLGTGCCKSKPDVTLGRNPIRYPGLETFPTPRTFDGPGTIFRIDEAQRQHLVATLDVSIDGPYSEALATVTELNSASIELVGQLLGQPSAFRDVSASAAAGRSALQFVDLGEGLRYRTSERELDAAIADLSIDFKHRNRYYVVREAIAVPSINYTLAEWVTASAGIKATLDEIAEGSASVTWKDFSARQLSQQFEEPHFVFYLPDEVFPPAPGILEGPGATPTRAPLDTREQWVIWVSEADRTAP